MKHQSSRREFLKRAALLPLGVTVTNVWPQSALAAGDSISKRNPGPKLKLWRRNGQSRTMVPYTWGNSGCITRQRWTRVFAGHGLLLGKPSNATGVGALGSLAWGLAFTTKEMGNGVQVFFWSGDGIHERIVAGCAWGRLAKVRYHGWKPRLRRPRRAGPVFHG